MLRVRVNATKETGLDRDSDILIDQILALDNSRFIKVLGKINKTQHSIILQTLSNIILDKATV